MPTKTPWTTANANHSHVNRYTQKFKHSIHSECLFRYDDPVSPHLAVKMKGDLTGDIVVSVFVPENCN